MKKTLRYNFRLKPTAEQEVKLVEFGAYARGLWNLLLSENMRRYQYDKTFVFYHKMAGLIRDLKKFEEFLWLKAFDSAASQQVARDLEVALKNSTMIVSGALIIPILSELKKVLLVSQKSAKCLLLCIEN